MQYAFFGADGALDLDAFRLQIGACLRAGVQGIAILGLATEVGKLSSISWQALRPTIPTVTGQRWQFWRSKDLNVAATYSNSLRDFKLSRLIWRHSRKRRCPCSLAFTPSLRHRACILWKPIWWSVW